MDRQEKLKVYSETPVKLFITHVTVKCMIQKLAKYIVNKIFYRYLNPVIRKDQIIFRHVCTLSLQVLLSTGNTWCPLTHWYCLFQQLITLDNFYWAWRPIWIWTYYKNVLCNKCLQMQHVLFHRFKLKTSQELPTHCIPKQEISTYQI